MNFHSDERMYEDATMYKIHITGYTSGVEDGLCYNSDEPIDVTVYACTVSSALRKAYLVTGKYISCTYRKIIVEEISRLLMR